jgi:hypothetical protein
VSATPVAVPPGGKSAELDPNPNYKKKPDTLIVPILFCYKTLYVSVIFSGHHQEFSTVHSALVSFMQVSDDRFQVEPGWNSVPS